MYIKDSSIIEGILNEYRREQEFLSIRISRTRTKGKVRLMDGNESGRLRDICEQMVTSDLWTEDALDQLSIAKTLGDDVVILNIPEDCSLTEVLVVWYKSRQTALYETKLELNKINVVFTNTGLYYLVKDILTKEEESALSDLLTYICGRARELGCQRVTRRGDMFHGSRGYIEVDYLHRGYMESIFKGSELSKGL